MSFRTEISLLLHRLPLDRAEICSLTAEAPAFETAIFPLVSLRFWTAASIALDLLCVVALAIGLHGTAAAPQPGLIAGLQPGVVPIVIASIVVWVLAAHVQGLYRRAPLVAEGSTLSQACVTGLIAFGVMLLVALGIHPGGQMSISLSVMATLCALGCVLATRLAWQGYLGIVLRRGYCLDRVMVLAGSAAEARQAGATIERLHRGRIRVAASAACPDPANDAGVQGVVDAIGQKIVDRVVIVAGGQGSDGLRALLPRLMRMSANVTLMTGRDAAGLSGPSAALVGLAPAEDLTDRPLSAGAALVKRTEDILIGVIALLFVAPVMAAIALAIKFDSPGPVFFIQKRVGLGGAVFHMWKFRTMHHHLADCSSTQQTRRNDHRVTRVGRYLRRSSLDELPQLINVLRGDMSIVGPRPHALGMTVAGRQLHEIAEGYAARHVVKPGITGWAQVNGCRGELDTERKLRRRLALDCHYIEHWSLRVDAWIMLRTAALFAFDRHAY